MSELYYEAIEYEGDRNGDEGGYLSSSHHHGVCLKPTANECCLSHFPIDLTLQVMGRYRVVLRACYKVMRSLVLISGYCLCIFPLLGMLDAQALQTADRVHTVRHPMAA